MRALVEADTALCIVTDNAHEVRGELGKFLDRDRVDRVLRGKSGASIHLLLTSHSGEWERAQPRFERWGNRAHRLSGLSQEDAKGLVVAYRREGQLGRLDASADDEMLAVELVKLASDRDGAGEAAMLGALLEARTGESFEVHVARILEGTKAADTPSVPASQTYLYTAAANAAGLHEPRQAVIAAAMGCPPEDVHRAAQVLRAELRESGALATATVRVRHSAIARSALATAFSALPGSQVYADKATIYKDLARAVVTVLPDFWKSPEAGPLLDQCVSARNSDPVLAIAIAEGAAAGQPSDDHLRSKLSQTYRKSRLKNARAAATTCEDFFTQSPDALGWDSIRPLVLEWGVASGEWTALPDHGARSAWLAMLCVSDQCGDETVPPDTLKHLPTISEGVRISALDLGAVEVKTAAGAIFAVGRRVKGTRYLTEVEDLAGDFAGKVAVSGLSAALTSLAALAWAEIDDGWSAKPLLPRDGKLTFTHLATAVAKHA
ncbi:MAG: hypothetical protein H6740_03415 [Alphaproteobacteria bacterium]|nr:hypothetical protein [Alphaproteobacteria bacterium]